MKHKILSEYAFALLMLLSGFAGISYEILYGRILGNMVGDQFVVSAAVLMTFLLGIGVGSILAHKLWRWLWAIEGGIGLYGILIAFNQPVIEKFVYSGSSLFADNLIGSVLACVALLIIPAFLIGCSVPLFAGYFSRLNKGHKASFSWVYMVYNLGAAFTALMIEFYFIRGLGIQGTVALFAAVNLLIAIGLKYQFTEDLLADNEAGAQAGKQEPSVSTLLSSVPSYVLYALILASVASAVFQLFMVKYAELIFGPFRESFALVLSLVLLGITLGSLMVKRFNLSFHHIMWLNLFGLLWLLVAAGIVPYIYAAIYPFTENSFWLVIVLKWLLLIALMLVPATTFGATIPALLSHKEEVSRESGVLLFISSLANVAGFLLMVFVLHRYLDYGVQLLVAAVFSVTALIVYQKKGVRQVLLPLLILGVMGGVYLKKWDEDLLYLSYTNFKNADKLVDARKDVQFPDRYKGYQDVFSINWMDGDPFFFINGYISIPLNNPSEKIVGALSTLFSPRLDDALVLGLGSGATASTVGLFFDQTDVVEINPVVRENLFRMKRWNFDIEGNAKVNIIVDDAIHFMKSGDTAYSLILNTVTTPLYFSSSKLYTKDFFDNVKTRLKDDGIYVTWMDSRIGDKGADIILRSLQGSFKYCAVSYVKSAYFLLVASDKPLHMSQQEAVVGNEELKQNLMEKHKVMSEWLPYQLMTTDVFSLIGDVSGDLNTADSPTLEFEMARLQESGIDGFKQRLRSSFDLADIEQAMSFRPKTFPGDLLMHVRERLGNSSITRRWDTLVQDEPKSNLDLAKLALRKVKMDVLQRPKDGHAYGYQLLKLERYPEAIQAFQKVLQNAPQHDNTYYNLGVCFEALGQYQQALVSFEKELEIDSQDEDASYRIARILVRMQRYDEALLAINDYIASQNIVQGKVFFYRAITHKALGHSKEAELDLLQAMKLGGFEKDIAVKSGLLKNL